MDELQSAIEAGDVSSVKRLLNAGVSPNTVSCGESPLLTCLKHNEWYIAHILIQAGADVNFKDRRGRSILSFSILLHNFCFFQLLLVEDSCEIDTYDEKGFTPLHFAALNEGEFVQGLLEKGADVNAVNHYGKTPLHYAILCRRPEERVKLLLKCGPEVGINMTLIEAAVKKCQVESREKVIDDLLDYGFQIREKRLKDSRFLIEAIRGGLYSLVEHLLQKGDDPNGRYRGACPLFAACQINNCAMVKLLLDYGGDLYANLDALHIAAKHDRVDLAVELLKSGIPQDAGSDKTQGHTPPFFNVNSPFRGETLILSAIRDDDGSAIQQLCNLGADINNHSERCGSPLHLACVFGHWRAVDTILRLGGDVNLLNSDGKTPAEFVHDWDTDSARIIRRHIQLLQSLGLQVADKNISFLLEDFDSTFMEELDSEVKLTKTTYIPNTGISLFRLLRSSEAETGNMKYIDKVLQFEDFQTKFKIFSDFIRAKISAGLKRRYFIEMFTANVARESCFLSQLPSLCLDHILSFLSTADLGISSGYYRPREDIQGFIPGTTYRLDNTSSDEPCSDEPRAKFLCIHKSCMG